MKKKLEIPANLTKDESNTKLTEEMEQLRNENAMLRGRSMDRSPVNSDSEPMKARRKFIGRRSKLDVTHFYHQYPDIVGGKVLRWVNDEDGEVQNMEFNSWQVVELVGQKNISDRRFVDERNSQTSKTASPVMIPAGRGKNHSHIYMVLMMKDKALYEADEVEHQRDQMRAQTAAYLGGRSQSAGQDNARVGTVETYAPNVGDGIRGMRIKQQLIER